MTQLTMKNKLSIVALCLFFILSLNSCTSIDSGEVGVKTWFGAAESDVLDPGFHIIGFAGVHKMSVRTESYTMSSTSQEGKQSGDDGLHVLTNDGAMPTLEVTVKYHIRPESAVQIFKTLGENYEDGILRPDIRSVIADVAVNYSSSDLYSSKRSEFVANAVSKLTAQMAKRGIVLEDLQLRRVVMPEQIQQAIQAKLAAQQQSEQMEFVLSKEKQEADRKRIEAQGIADFQKIVSAGISEPLLRWKGIEATEKLATSDNAKMVIVGGKDGLPLILNQ